MKTTRIFHLKVFVFLVVKFSIYLNRLVFVMMETLRVTAVLFVGLHMFHFHLSTGLSGTLFSEILEWAQ